MGCFMVDQLSDRSQPDRMHLDAVSHHALIAPHIGNESGIFINLSPLSLASPLLEAYESRVVDEFAVVLLGKWSRCGPQSGMPQSFQAVNVTVLFTPFSFFLISLLNGCNESASL
jgi:hypothetical protein